MAQNMQRTFTAVSSALLIACGLAACESSGPSPEDQARAARLEERSERLDDAAISSRVAAAILEDGSLKDSEIHVETVDNVVHLYGYVLRPDDAARADQIALNIRDVRRVKDDLVVR